MNWGIFSLLACIGGVLGGVAAFFVFLARRSAQADASLSFGLGDEPLAGPELCRNDPPHSVLLQGRANCVSSLPSASLRPALHHSN
jgi:hypothetical protein